VVRAFVRLREMLSAHGGIGKEAFGVGEKSGGCHVRKPVGLHKGMGSASQAADAFCFIELSIATQGYA